MLDCSMIHALYVINPHCQSHRIMQQCNNTTIQQYLVKFDAIVVEIAIRHVAKTHKMFTVSSLLFRGDLEVGEEDKDKDKG